MNAAEVKKALKGYREANEACKAAPDAMEAAKQEHEAAFAEAYRREWDAFANLVTTAVEYTDGAIRPIDIKRILLDQPEDLERLILNAV